jgi:uncharacterized membrane protein YbaN (DUF454 family)
MTKAILIILGTISLAVGIIGAFVPILPTTPFVLLAAVCYVRSSQRIYAWVMRSRFAGPHVENVLAGRGIPLSVKIIAVCFSFSVIGYICLFRTESFIVRLVLGAIFAIQVFFMVKIPTLRKPATDRQPGPVKLEEPLA